MFLSLPCKCALASRMNIPRKDSGRRISSSQSFSAANKLMPSLDSLQGSKILLNWHRNVPYEVNLCYRVKQVSSYAVCVRRLSSKKFSKKFNCSTYVRLSSKWHWYKYPSYKVWACPMERKTYSPSYILLFVSLNIISQCQTLSNETKATLNKGKWNYIIVRITHLEKPNKNWGCVRSISKY